jgi:hypothetical protein
MFYRFSFKVNVWSSIFYVFNGNRFGHQNIRNCNYHQR